jgi:hypothetical protein
MQKIATINVKFLAKTCDRDSKKPWNFQNVPKLNEKYFMKLKHYLFHVPAGTRYTNVFEEHS